MSSAETYIELQDKKVNGPKGYKTTAFTSASLYPSVERLHFKTFWRAATDLAPGFNFKVTYHYPSN